MAKLLLSQWQLDSASASLALAKVHRRGSARPRAARGRGLREVGRRVQTPFRRRGSARLLQIWARWPARRVGGRRSRRVRSTTSAGCRWSALVHGHRRDQLDFQLHVISRHHHLHTLRQLRDARHAQQEHDKQCSPVAVDVAHYGKRADTILTRSAAHRLPEPGR